MMKWVATKPAATPRASARWLALGSRTSLLLTLLLLSGWLVLPAQAQQANSSDSGSGQSSSSTTSSTQDKQQNQQTPPAHKSAAQENPFPSDVSKQAAQQSQPGDAPAAPDAGQQAPQKPNSAAKDNPFPEDVSKGAAAAAAKDSDASGDSSSSSSSSSSADDTDPNADLPRNTGRRKYGKASEDLQNVSPAARAQDDVKVGRFYLGTGDYKGAYARFSDASRMDPTSVDAIYGLAAAAAGLHHMDEALTNYKLYLEIAPDGNDAKSARKALRALAK
jgi:tetratricopeptide (TPR) repeat protein